MNRMIAMACIVLAGCSAKPRIEVVSLDGRRPQADVVLAGVPFRIPAEQNARLYRFNPESGTEGDYEEVAVVRSVAPDLSRLYVIDVEGLPMASPSLKVGMNADNTLKSLGVTSSASAAAGASLLSAATAVRKAETDQSTAQVTAAASVLTAQRELAAAIVAFNDYKGADPTLRAVYEAAVDAARRRLAASCSAAAQAGAPCP